LNVKGSLDWLFKDAQSLSTIADASKLEYAWSAADGTAAGQADKIWHDQRSLASAASEDLTLTALAVSLFDGALSIALAKVRAVWIVNTAATAGEDLLIGGAGGHEWSGPFGAAGQKIRCPADSCLLLTNKLAGWTVTAGATNLLRIANAGSGTISYKIVIVGVSV